LVYCGHRKKARNKLKQPDDVYQFLRRELKDLTQETFLVIHIDGARQPIGYHIASVGTVNAALVHPREVFRAAIWNGAATVIVAHNHPSGNAKASPEDVETVHRLEKAGELVGIPVVDAVIVVNEGYIPLRKERQMVLAGKN
jgi:DNA repair protein RadC